MTTQRLVTTNQNDTAVDERTAVQPGTDTPTGLPFTETGAIELAELGDVLLPGDDGYDAASNTLFALGAPDLIARPADAEQVVAAVGYAIGNCLDLSVRSGGHSPAGLSTSSAGVVIDLSRFDQIEVLDRATRRVRIGAGATWGAVSEALGGYGWGITAGDTRSVGVGGLTLGGGMGWLVRKYGLALDSVVGAEVVLADGRIVRAAADEHPDLFWGLRGGGGNFGVVLSLDFIAQPITSVHFGTISIALGDPSDLVRGWRDAMRTADENLTSTRALLPPMMGRPASAMVLCCYADPDQQAADAALEPLRALGSVQADTIRLTPYPEVLEDAHHPPGMRIVARNTLLPSLSDEVIGGIVRAFESGSMMLTLRSLGCAVARVGAYATAYAHRDSEAMLMAGILMPMDATDAQIDEALADWKPLAAQGSGPYINFQGTATTDDVRAAYPAPTLRRLSLVKRQYDPRNVFRRNHNVEPAEL